jgi:hypothetical protein
MMKMKRRIMVPAAALIGVTAVGCDGPQPTDPLSGEPLFATTRSAVTATIGPLAVTGPGNIWVSNGILHVRDQLLAGPVSGDIVGSISVIANSNVALGTLNGTAFGSFAIATAAGSWEGTFQGRFAGGLLADKVVARGTGGLGGLQLTGSFAETGPATNTYVLTAQILNPGG